MLGHVLDGHVPRQVQGIALEGAGVALLGVGEAELDLTHVAAGEAEDARHLESMKAGLPPMGTVRKVRSTPPWAQTLSVPQCGAAEAFAGLSMRKVTRPSCEVLADMVVADEAEGVIQ